MSHLVPDRLLILALAEEQPDFTESTHLRSCEGCRTELGEMSHIVGLGRGRQELRDLPPPSPELWNRIQSTVFGTAGRVRPLTPRRRVPAAVRTAAIALAAALVAILATLGLTSGRGGGPTDRVLASADLAPQDPAVTGAHGRVELIDNGDGRQLRVTVSGLPTTDGFYEIWLYDGKAAMIPVGALGSAAQTIVSVPPSADQTVFTIVDVSAQQLGQQAHGKSLLQGQLR